MEPSAGFRRCQSIGHRDQGTWRKKKKTKKNLLMRRFTFPEYSGPIDATCGTGLTLEPWLQMPATKVAYGDSSIEGYRSSPLAPQQKAGVVQPHHRRVPSNSAFARVRCHNCGSCTILSIVTAEIPPDAVDLNTRDHFNQLFPNSPSRRFEFLYGKSPKAHSNPSPHKQTITAGIQKPIQNSRSYQDSSKSDHTRKHDTADTITADSLQGELCDEFEPSELDEESIDHTSVPNKRSSPFPTTAPTSADCEKIHKVSSNLPCETIYVYSSAPTDGPVYRSKRPSSVMSTSFDSVVAQKDESTEVSDNAPFSSDSSDLCYGHEREPSQSKFCLNQHPPSSTVSAGSIFELHSSTCSRADSIHLTGPEKSPDLNLQCLERNWASPENSHLQLGQLSPCTQSEIIDQFVCSLHSPTAGRNWDSESNLGSRSPFPGPQMSLRRWNSRHEGRDPIFYHQSSNIKKMLDALSRIKKVIIKITGSNIRNPKDYRRKVVVNGVAIRDDCVRRAELQAGPIHPGKYWYDSRAGFWGVAGGPCLGIIPPFIDELDYPMARDCAAGSTGINVNGRELHNLDLQKLVSRGFPTVTGMAYRVDIDGRLVELSSGAELRILGHLAPSLKKNHGSGMYSLPIVQLHENRVRTRAGRSARGLLCTIPGAE